MPGAGVTPLPEPTATAGPDDPAATAEAPTTDAAPAPEAPLTTLSPAATNALFEVTHTGTKTPLTDLSTAPTRPQEFTFSLLSDRTGFARTGVFQRGIEVTNMFRPDFAVQIGDSIEGYTEDLEKIVGQWEEFDAITDELDEPLFRVPGNHDISNPTMREEWLRRHGALYYAFRYRNVHFVVLDTQDPPQSFEDMGMTAEQFAGLETRMLTTLEEDPDSFFAAHDDAVDGPMPANFSEEQIRFFEETVEANQDVDWTFVLMHMPVWQDRENAAYQRFRAALGERDFTMFAGHCHNYRREVIDGRDHIRLSSTGGVWTTSNPEGSWDHVALVQMTPNGPPGADNAIDQRNALCCIPAGMQHNVSPWSISLHSSGSPSPEQHPPECVDVAHGPPIDVHRVPPERTEVHVPSFLPPDRLRSVPTVDGVLAVTVHLECRTRRPMPEIDRVGTPSVGRRHADLLLPLLPPSEVEQVEFHERLADALRKVGRKLQKCPDDLLLTLRVPTDRSEKVLPAALLGMQRRLGHR